MTDKRYDVLDRPEVLGVLFYPRRDFDESHLPADVHLVRIPVDDGNMLGGKVYVAAQTAPVILFFHGNGEIASDYDTIASFYTELGLTLVVVDYRGYGASDGSPTATALVRDALTTFERIGDVFAEVGIQPERLYVMGRSLGSAAALEVASRATGGLDGLILESGFAYTFPLIERIGFLQLPDAYEQKDGFGNLEKIDRVTLPTLIIHGERDWIIPIGDARALYEASPATNKKLVSVPGAGHNDLMMIGRRAYFGAIAELCGTAPQSA
ncbi:MAG: alpha/beta fold hydrolase [Rhodospirillales bacterium]|nr:alpha/beta fold hydrolase [Rhodospirillales bacterium]